MKILNQSEIEEALKGLPGWQWRDNTVRAEYRFGSYPECVAFAVEVALMAERMNHHPDALTVCWGRVSVSYTTHSQGGVTESDLKAAKKVSEVAKRRVTEVNE